MNSAKGQEAQMETATKLDQYQDRCIAYQLEIRELREALEKIAGSGLAKDSADARFLCSIARAALAKARA